MSRRSVRGRWSRSGVNARAVALLLAAAVALAAAIVLGPTGRAPRVRWGLAVSNTAVDPGALEAALGHPFGSIGVYVALSSPRFPNALALRARREGAQIYLNINSWRVVEDRKVCYPWARVASGRYDALLLRWARRIVAFGNRNLIISFHHEPNLEGDPREPACGTAAAYRAAYDHVANFLRSHGVTAPFVWTLTAGAFQRGGADPWRPAAFDLLGVDGYNRDARGRWLSFASIFGPAHAYAERLGVQMVLGEVGSVESPTDARAKARWFQDAGRAIRGWADVAAVEWTDSPAYRPDSSRISLSGWVQALREGRFVLGS